MRKYFKTIVGIVLMILGKIAIIMSLSSSFYTGTISNQKVYGGDAYTGIQNTTADLTEDIVYMDSNMISIYRQSMVFKGVCFVSAGVLFILYDYSSRKKK